MTILAIETSCDETSIALVMARGGMRAPKFEVKKNIVSSQIRVHAPYGGVVPNLAKREHQKNLPTVLSDAIEGLSEKEKIDVLAVTVGPGLEPALWTGITFVKDLKKKWSVPIIGTSHLEGHLYSFLLNKNIGSLSKLFPAVCLLVSGGHTILVRMDSLTSWKKLGETRDDAAGEAFDKVARMLGLPYPGGAEIELLSKKGKANAIDFPRPMRNTKNFDFSFSGLKTAVLYYLRDNKRAKKADVAAAFQEAAIDVLSHKTLRAAELCGAKSVMLSGGVAANRALRNRLRGVAKECNSNFLVADKIYNTDNAAMIAVAGYISKLQNKKRVLRAKGNMSL